MADTAYDAAIAYAADRGATDGTNAAGWYTQETVGGRVTSGAADSARRILRGIEDGDPAIMDGLPSADLSGEWADTLTGPTLYRESCESAGLVESDGAYSSFDSICDAYEIAYATAAESAIAAACAAVLA